MAHTGLRIVCPECKRPGIAVMKTKAGYFVRTHRMGIIVKHKCSMSRVKIPIQIGMKIV